MKTLRDAAVVALTIAFLILLLWPTGCTFSATPAGPDDDDDTAGPDASPPDAPEPVEPAVPPEVDGKLTINEIMAANVLTIADDAGHAGDWIEIYNPTEVDVPLHGYYVTDDLATPKKAWIADGVVVPSGGRALLWLDGEPSQGADHVGVKLEKNGGEVALARPDGSYIDRIAYGAQAVDLSASREPDGSDAWVIEWHASPGAANPVPASGGGQPVGIEDVSAPPESVADVGDLTEKILGYDEMPAFGLELSADAIASLESDPRTYVEGMLVYQDRSYGPVGVRLKGGNSFLPIHEKPSLRINIDEYVPGAKVFGLDDLTLNNMSSDFSMMHERLAYWVMRNAGVPASRANHCTLTINGEPYGLYTNLETVKHQMMERWFADGSGPLFEGLDVDFTAAYVPQFELESGPDDRSLLYSLAEALTMASADQAMAMASEYVDLAQFRRFWAVEAILAQLDAFPYSNPGDDYHVYADPTSQSLWFIPWGMDETFYSAELDILATHSILARRCKESPACKQALIDEIYAVLDEVESMGWAAEYLRIQQQIALYVPMDSRKPYSNAQVADFQQQMWWFITERRTHIDTILQQQPIP